jgi:hypothetical protein
MFDSVEALPTGMGMAWDFFAHNSSVITCGTLSPDAPQAHFSDMAD